MVRLQEKYFDTDKNIRLFGLNLNGDERRQLYSKLFPISEIFNTHPESSLNVLKDGELYLVEALVYKDLDYKRAQSLDFSLNQAIEKIVPKIKRIANEDQPQIYEVG